MLTIGNAMTWDALAAVGELLGAIGVIALEVLPEQRFRPNRIRARVHLLMRSVE